MTERDPKALRRNDFPVLRILPTRWSDDDTYGHVDNVVHYSMFDTAVNGWLIFKSTFLPRWLGVLSLVGALGWTTFAYPPLGAQLFLPLALYALAVSVVMIGWLLVKGVDEERWRAMASGQ